MSAMSDFLEKELLDHVFGAAAYTAPATLYFGLFTAAPDDAGNGTEVATGSYARIGVTNNLTNFPAATTVTSTTTKKNGTTIQFVQATASWGTVTHWAVFDALTTGNLIVWGALSASRSVASGDAPRFLTDAFSLTAD